MKTDLRRFLAERAEYLAFLELTRSGDLVVTRVATPDTGLDFLVTVVRRGKPTGRIFGVQVKALEGSAGRAADLEHAIDPRSLADAPFPFCVFAFTMSDDRGYYRWLKEPVLGPRRKPGLRPGKPSEWNELDDEALNRIAELVDAWYEAQQHAEAA